MLFEVDLQKRIERGEYINSKEFDLKIFARKVKELVKEYGIKYDPSEVIPTDNSLIKSVFEAGFKLALEVGVYCLSNKRKFQVFEEEIHEVLKSYHSEIVVGLGKDARVLYHRDIEDSRYPIIIGGYAGTPTPINIFIESAITYAKEPLVDAIDHGSINEVFGVRIASLSPLEVYACRLEIRMVREALNRVGRPGLHIIGGESAVTSVGALAIMNEEYLRKSDGLLVPVLNEMKVDYHTLNKALAFSDYGGYVVSLVDPLLGGFAGGPEGTAICSIAEVLISSVVYRADYFLIHPTHIFMLATSVPECMWVQSVVGQALAKYTPFIAVGNVWPANGGGTEEVIYETIANTIVNTVSGLHLIGVTTTAGKLPNSTGLEARIMAYTARYVVEKKINRKEANDIVIKLISYYKDTLRKPKLGRPFNELYDMKTLNPTSNLINTYNIALEKVKQELGLEIAALEKFKKSKV